MRNARIILWLLAVTFAAVAANLYLSWRGSSVGGRQRRALLESSFVPNRVEIDRKGAPRTVLERNDRWRLTQPYSGTVNAQAVLRLVDQLTVAPVTSSMTDGEIRALGRTRADFGLDEPSLKLFLSDGGEKVALSFGVLTPASNGVYVAVGGSDSVFVVPASVCRLADVGAEAFREREVFPYAPEFVLDFDLRPAGGAQLSFSRNGDGWNVGATAASAAKVNGFLSRLTEASAVDFLWPLGTTNEETTVSEARLVGYGLDASSALSVTLRCRDGVDRRILIGNDAGEGHSYALVHNGTAIVSLDSALKQSVLDGTRSFVDARLFPLDESSVSSFSLTVDGVSYVVARAEEGNWRLDAPIDAPADSQMSAAVLRRILALTPFDKTGDGIRVSVSTNQESCVVPSRVVLGEARLEDLRSSEIMRVDASLVKRLVSTPGGKNPRPSSSVVYSRERKTWNAEIEGGADHTVDADRVERLLSALSPLKASRVVTLTASTSDLSRYGLEQPFHTLAVDQEKDGAVRRNVFIGAETHDGRYATVGSSDAIFVLPKKTVEALVAPLIE